jgi:hypothetical protein
MVWGPRNKNGVLTEILQNAILFWALQEKKKKKRRPIHLQSDARSEHKYSERVKLSS